jgi:cytochrome P460
LISVAHIGSIVNDVRAKLGNDVAIKAYREGKLPFPDGTIIARLAWSCVPSEENDKALRPILERKLSPDAVQKVLAESFVAGPATNVQFMVKDARKYASTGGWGFAQFDNGKPADEAVHKTCSPCHAPAKDRDFVFTRYAP